VIFCIIPQDKKKKVEEGIFRIKALTVKKLIS